MYLADSPLQATTHPDIRLPVRIAPELEMRWVLAHLPAGSRIHIFGPSVQGRHRTTYRRLFCPDSGLHGYFVAETINGLKLLAISGEEGQLRDRATSAN